MEAERPVHAETVTLGPQRRIGDWAVPEDPQGVVLFAHGSGSSRLSPRNRSVAQVLQGGRLATLLFDLLREDEADDRRKVFDIALLAERLGEAAEWVAGRREVQGLRVGYFGASTGAAAALVAAARHPQRVGAVVSRGGRPDLAECYLEQVRAPTLLIVGQDDKAVLEMNRWALRQLACPKQLEIIPGATHLFPEPGALQQVASLARAWFTRHLAPQGAAQP